MSTQTVEIPLVGTIVRIPAYAKANGHDSDISYEIISTQTFQQEPGQFATICTFVALDTDAYQIETIEPFTLNLDMYDTLDA